LRAKLPSIIATMLEHAMGIDDIRAAAARLPGRIHRTPVITVRSFDERCGHTVFFKCENLQRAGAFKIRGALNKLLTLTDEERRRGVTGFSSGKQKDADRRSPRLRRGDRGGRSLPPFRGKLLVEPTGAVPAAALLAGKLPMPKGSRVGVVLSGGNIDPALLAEILGADG
jgi:threonine dehydratase